MLLLILFLLGPSSGMESGKTRACDVLMVIDSPLFELYDKNMSAVVELAQDHINGLNEIFFKELFVDDYQSLYFFLKRVQVAFGSCDSPLFEEGYDSNCTRHWSRRRKERALLLPVWLFLRDAQLKVQLSTKNQNIRQSRQRPLNSFLGHMK